MNNDIKSSKSNAGIIIVILVLVIIGLGVYILYSSGIILKKQNENNQENNNQTIEKVEEETELTDETLKNDVYIKLSTLVGVPIEDDRSYNYPKELFYRTYCYNSLDEINDESLRLGLAVQSANRRSLSRRATESEREKLIEKVNDQTKALILGNYDYHVLDAKILENVYFDLYGKNPNHNSTKKCGYDYDEYDDELKIYYAPYSDGGYTGPIPIVMINIDKYTIKNDEIYVYLDIAYAKRENNTLYKGYKENSDKFIMEDNSIANLYNDEAVQNYIDINHEKFGKYRMVFSKNSKGLYSFNRIEEL